MTLRILRPAGRTEAEAALFKIGVDPVGVASMAAKMSHFNIKIPSLECRAANIIKQDMLSLGGDAAVARGTVECSIPATDVILMGTEKQLHRAVKKFRQQPFGIRKIAEDLDSLLSSADKNFTINYGPGTLDLGGMTHIMGILNVTPDSFSDGGRFNNIEAAVARAVEMVNDGAHIIDVGGESTRPGAVPASAEEELDRIIPVIEKIASIMDTPISVDTYKAEVAEKALEAGAHIINDISGLTFDKNMASVAARADCPVILMHTGGRPQNMQDNPHYDSIMDEILDFLEASINSAVSAGISHEKIIADPGIGFGKRLEDNLAIIKNFGQLKVLDVPLLIGASRKSFIGQIIGSDPKNTDDRIEGSIAASVLAAASGASIVRVHDVKETNRALKIADAVKRVH